MAFVLSLWTAGIGAIAGVALAGLFIAYDGFDYPLSRRGASFGKKWAYLATHPAQTIGFGVGATLLYLIPFALFVAPSFVAAGATPCSWRPNGEKSSRRQQRRTRSGAGKSRQNDGKMDGQVRATETTKKPAEM